MRRTWLVVLAVAVFLVRTPMAGAQEVDELIGQVDISFDVGAFDSELNDWPIDVVVVSGDLAAGEVFTVQLLGDGGEVLFESTQPYSDVPTRIDVGIPVSVGEVASAGVSQAQPIVGGVVIERPEVEWSASGGGGSGQLALSMVMAVIIVAIVFRSPLPSASTERWTK